MRCFVTRRMVLRLRLNDGGASGSKPYCLPRAPSGGNRSSARLRGLAPVIISCPAGRGDRSLTRSSPGPALFFPIVQGPVHGRLSLRKLLREVCAHIANFIFGLFAWPRHCGKKIILSLETTFRIRFPRQLIRASLDARRSVNG